MEIENRHNVERSYIKKKPNVCWKCFWYFYVCALTATAGLVLRCNKISIFWFPTSCKEFYIWFKIDSSFWIGFCYQLLFFDDGRSSTFVTQRSASFGVLIFLALTVSKHMVAWNEMDRFPRVSVRVILIPWYTALGFNQSFYFGRSTILEITG